MSRGFYLAPQFSDINGSKFYYFYALPIDALRVWTHICVIVCEDREWGKADGCEYVHVQCMLSR